VAVSEALSVPIGSSILATFALCAASAYGDYQTCMGPGGTTGP
jgi:hypothetical protein